MSRTLSSSTPLDILPSNRNPVIRLELISHISPFIDSGSFSSSFRLCFVCWDVLLFLFVLAFLAPDLSFDPRV